MRPGPFPAPVPPRRRAWLPADLLAAALVLGVFWFPAASDARAPSAFMLCAVLGGVAAAAMLLRDWRPAEATVTAGLVTVAANALGVSQDPMLATAWCLYSLAVSQAPRSRGLVVALVGLLGAVAAVTGVPSAAGGDGGQRLVLATAALCVAWLLGTAVGRQVAGAREAERARIQLAVARDVHDVVGHALGVISAQAGVTLTLPDAGDRELRDTLAAVEAQARRGLEEIQQLVRTLRSDPDDPRAAATPADATGVDATGTDATGTHDAGLVEHLLETVEVTRAAGIAVRARIRLGGVGEGHVDDAVGTTALRVLQEGLSNVIRHAPGAECTVEVREEGGEIVIRVRDQGPGEHRHAPPDLGRGGVGLLGVRERARLLGGSADWRDRPDGGFELVARLPLCPVTS